MLSLVTFWHPGEHTQIIGRPPDRVSKIASYLGSLLFCMRLTCPNPEHHDWDSNTRRTRTLASLLLDDDNRPKATIPSGYVYSVLAIASDGDVEVGYAKPAGQLFREIAAYLFVEAGPYVLACCTCDDSSEAGPSWVLRHDLPPGTGPLGSPSDARRFREQFAKKELPFRLDGEKVHWQARRLTSVPQGARIQACPRQYDGSSEYSNQGDWNYIARAWLGTYQENIDSYPSDSTKALADMWWRLPIPPKGHPDQQLALDAGKGRRSFDKVMRDHDARALGIETHHDSLYWNSLLLGVIERVVFEIEEGDLALGPMKIEPGDEIFALRGGDYPFVIRPVSDGCFTLVGEAYLPLAQDPLVLSEDWEGGEWITIV